MDSTLMAIFIFISFQIKFLLVFIKNGDDFSDEDILE